MIHFARLALVRLLSFLLSWVLMRSEGGGGGVVCWLAGWLLCCTVVVVVCSVLDDGTGMYYLVFLFACWFFHLFVWIPLSFMWGWYLVVLESVWW